MARTIPTGLPGWLRTLLVVATLAVITAAPASARQPADEPPPPTDDGSATVAIGQVELRVETGGAVTTASLADSREAFLREMQETLGTIVGHTPPEPVLIRFAGELPEGSNWLPVTGDAAITDDATEAVVLLDPYLALSDTDARNLLTNLAARHWLASASGGTMPAPLVDGFARYLEEPVLARQARQASLAQQAYLDGELPSWSELLADPEATTAIDPDAGAAARLAVAAFLVERYGASMVADLAARFVSAPDADPVALVAEVTGQEPERLDAAWEDFIAVWFAGGWRANAFASLDLAPAEDLFARGAYEAAVDYANQTLQVTSTLGDPIASAEAEMLAAQGSVGMQAEALMRDAEEALRNHEYDRALTLIDRAVDQYALLPEDHRPGNLIETWRGLAEDGAGAIARLQSAAESQDDWFATRETRRDAVAAGETFARLGDTNRLALANDMVDDLDERVMGLAFALGAAILALLGWLAVWSWNRSLGRVRWPGLRDLAHEGALR